MPSKPADRNLQQELGQLLGFWEQNNGRLYNVDANQAGRYTGINTGAFNDAVGATLPTLLGAQEATGAGNADAARSQRFNDFADVQSLAGLHQGARHNINPALYQNMDIQDAAAREGIGASMYEQELGRRALQAPGGADLGRVSGVGAGERVNAAAVGAPLVGGSRGVRAQGVGVAGPSGLSGALNTGAQQGSAGAIEGNLYSQSLQDLQRGGELSEQEVYQSRQDSRAAADARGLGEGNAAIAGEVLNLDALRRGRRNEAQDRAAGVEQLRLGRVGQDQSFGLGVEGLNAGYRQDLLTAGRANQGAGLQAQLANQGDRAARDFANQGTVMQAQLANQGAGLQAAGLNLGDAYQRDALNASIQGQNAGIALNEAQFNAGEDQRAIGNLYQADAMGRSRGSEQFNQLQQATGNRINTFYDPAASLGRAPTNELNAGTAAGLGAGLINTGPSMNDLLPYASDVNSTNYNGAMDAYNSSKNNKAGVGSSALGALGSLGGAAILAGVI